MKTPLLVRAVLREDGVVTRIHSGENEGKALLARFPARQTSYDFIELDGKTPTTRKLSFQIEPGWDKDNLRLAVFVQDKRSGVVHQAVEIPWRSTTKASSTKPGSANLDH